MIKIKLLAAFIIVAAFTSLQAQVNLSTWLRNTDGKKASYFETSSSMPPTYTFTISPDSANVLAVAYNSSFVYIRSHGLTDSMGKFLNPGNCLAQSYTHKFPQTPTVPATKSISRKGGQIGLLINGVPIYGLSNSYSYNGSINTNMGGSGIWNVEVGKSEGFVLDTVLGAHPQQQGAYHSHDSPKRLYSRYATSQHSPLIGFAFDGYPVYGPYGYSSAMNSGSAVTRMKTGYSLRNITTRTTLPYGVAASQTGPPVNTTYPIGTYCEDYEWLVSNGGDLDKYNGRTCVTPEYPGGTYAYFVTIDAAGAPAFPYYIGIEYYGAPEVSNFPSGPTGNGLTLPTSGVTYYTGTVLAVKILQFTGKANRNINTLSWSLGSTGSINKIVLQRSFDGNNFSDISAVSLNASNNYSYDDKQPLQKNFYRLKIIETSGEVTYSGLVNLNNTDRNTFFIYPSITKNLINIQGLTTASSSTVLITDASGRKVLNKQITPGQSQISVDISSLSNGFYFVTITNNGAYQTAKILKN